jgi:hypothetical protein
MNGCGISVIGALLSVHALGASEHAMAGDPILPNASIKSVGIVTFDAEKTARRFAAVFGANTLTVLEQEVAITDFRSGSAVRSKATLRTAAGNVKDRHFELIETTQGTSPFKELLVHREGPAAYYVSVGELPNAGDVIKKMKASGYKMQMQILTKDGQLHTYVDMSDQLGSVLEFSSPAGRATLENKTANVDGLSAVPLEHGEHGCSQVQCCLTAHPFGRAGGCVLLLTKGKTPLLESRQRRTDQSTIRPEAGRLFNKRCRDRRDGSIQLGTPTPRPA